MSRSYDETVQKYNKYLSNGQKTRLQSDFINISKQTALDRSQLQSSAIKTRNKTNEMLSNFGLAGQLRSAPTSGLDWKSRRMPEFHQELAKLNAKDSFKMNQQGQRYANETIAAWEAEAAAARKRARKKSTYIVTDPKTGRQQEYSSKDAAERMQRNLNFDYSKDQAMEVIARYNYDKSNAYSGAQIDYTRFETPNSEGMRFSLESDPEFASEFEKTKGIYGSSPAAFNGAKLTPEQIKSYNAVSYATRTLGLFDLSESVSMKADILNNKITFDDIQTAIDERFVQNQNAISRYYADILYDELTNSETSLNYDPEFVDRYTNAYNSAVASGDPDAFYNMMQNTVDYIEITTNALREQYNLQNQYIENVVNEYVRKFGMDDSYVDLLLGYWNEGDVKKFNETLSRYDEYTKHEIAMSLVKGYYDIGVLTDDDVNTLKSMKASEIESALQGKTGEFMHDMVKGQAELYWKSIQSVVENGYLSTDKEHSDSLYNVLKDTYNWALHCEDLGINSTYAWSLFNDTYYAIVRAGEAEEITGYLKSIKNSADYNDLDAMEEEKLSKDIVEAYRSGDYEKLNSLLGSPLMKKNPIDGSHYISVYNYQQMDEYYKKAFNMSIEEYMRYKNISDEELVADIASCNQKLDEINLNTKGLDDATRFAERSRYMEEVNKASTILAIRTANNNNDLREKYTEMDYDTLKADYDNSVEELNSLRRKNEYTRLNDEETKRCNELSSNISLMGLVLSEKNATLRAEELSKINSTEGLADSEYEYIAIANKGKETSIIGSFEEGRRNIIGDRDIRFYDGYHGEYSGYSDKMLQNAYDTASIATIIDPNEEAEKTLKNILSEMYFRKSIGDIKTNAEEYYSSANKEYFNKNLGELYKDYYDVYYDESLDKGYRSNTLMSILSAIATKPEFSGWSYEPFTRSAATEYIATLDDDYIKEHKNNSYSKVSDSYLQELFNYKVGNIENINIVNIDEESAAIVAEMAYRTRKNGTMWSEKDSYRLGITEENYSDYNSQIIHDIVNLSGDAYTDYSNKLVANNGDITLGGIFKATELTSIGILSAVNPYLALKLYNFAEGTEAAFGLQTKSAVSSMIETANAYKEFMTEAEKQKMNYLFETDPEAAKEYLTSLGTYISERRAESLKTYAEKTAENNPILSHLATYALTPLESQGGIYIAWKTLAGEDVDTYSKVFDIQLVDETIRSKHYSMFEEDCKKVWNSEEFAGAAVFVMQTLDSMVDSWINVQSGMRVAKGFNIDATTKAFKTVTELFSLPGTGLRSASSTYRELAQQGYPQDTCKKIAILAGINEMLFEKLSLENFLTDRVNGMKLWKILLSQGGVEASEEVFTELSNMLVEASVLGYQDDYHTDVADAMLAGYTRAEAQSLAMMNQFKRVALAGLGGFLSGAGMGSSNVLETGHQMKISGAYNAMYGNAKETVALGLQSQDSDVVKLSESLRSQMEKTGTYKFQDLGRLNYLMNINDRELMIGVVNDSISDGSIDSKQGKSIIQAIEDVYNEQAWSGRTTALFKGLDLSKLGGVTQETVNKLLSNIDYQFRNAEAKATANDIAEAYKTNQMTTVNEEGDTVVAKDIEDYLHTGNDQKVGNVTLRTHNSEGSLGLNTEQKMILRYYQAVASMFGDKANFVIHDTLPMNANGATDEDGTIHFSLDTNRPLASVAHEITHYLKSSVSEESWNSYVKFIKETLRNQKVTGNTETSQWDILYKSIENKYGKEYEDRENKEALFEEEVVASASEGVLLDKAFAKSLFLDNKPLFRSIYGFVSDFLGAFKKFKGYQTVNYDSAAGYLMKNVDTYEKIRQMWGQMIKESKTGEKASFDADIPKIEVNNVSDEINNINIAENDVVVLTDEEDSTIEEINDTTDKINEASKEIDDSIEEVSKTIEEETKAISEEVETPAENVVEETKEEVKEETNKKKKVKKKAEEVSDEEKIKNLRTRKKVHDAVKTADIKLKESVNIIASDVTKLENLAENISSIENNKSEENASKVVETVSESTESVESAETLVSVSEKAETPKAKESTPVEEVKEEEKKKKLGKQKLPVEEIAKKIKEEFSIYISNLSKINNIQKEIRDTRETLEYGYYEGDDASVKAAKDADEKHISDLELEIKNIEITNKNIRDRVSKSAKSNGIENPFISYRKSTPTEEEFNSVKKIGDNIRKKIKKSIRNANKVLENLNKIREFNKLLSDNGFNDSRYAFVEKYYNNIQKYIVDACEQASRANKAANGGDTVVTKEDIETRVVIETNNPTIADFAQQSAGLAIIVPVSNNSEINNSEIEESTDNKKAKGKEITSLEKEINDIQNKLENIKASKPSASTMYAAKAKLVTAKSLYENAVKKNASEEIVGEKLKAYDSAQKKFDELNKQNAETEKEAELKSTLDEKKKALSELTKGFYKITNYNSKGKPMYLLYAEEDAEILFPDKYLKLLEYNNKIKELEQDIVYRTIDDYLESSGISDETLENIFGYKDVDRHHEIRDKIQKLKKDRIDLGWINIPDSERFYYSTSHYIAYTDVDFTDGKLSFNHKYSDDIYDEDDILVNDSAFKGLKDSKEITLGDYIYKWNLYNIHPELRDIKLIYSDDDSGIVFIRYSWDSNEIIITKSALEQNFHDAQEIMIKIYKHVSEEARKNNIAFTHLTDMNNWGKTFDRGFIINPSIGIQDIGNIESTSFYSHGNYLQAVFKDSVMYKKVGQHLDENRRLVKGTLSNDIIPSWNEDAYTETFPITAYIMTGDFNDFFSNAREQFQKEFREGSDAYNHYKYYRNLASDLYAVLASEPFWMRENQNAYFDVKFSFYRDLIYNTIDEYIMTHEDETSKELGVFDLLSQVNKRLYILKELFGQNWSVKLRDYIKNNREELFVDANKNMDEIFWRDDDNRFDDYDNLDFSIGGRYYGKALERMTSVSDYAAILKDMKIRAVNDYDVYGLQVRQYDSMDDILSDKSREELRKTEYGEGHPYDFIPLDDIEFFFTNDIDEAKKLLSKYGLDYIPVYEHGKENIKTAFKEHPNVRYMFNSNQELEDAQSIFTKEYQKDDKGKYIRDEKKRLIPIPNEETTLLKQVKDKVNFSAIKDPARNLDAFAGENTELRNLLAKLFERPLATAKNNFRIDLTRKVEEFRNVMSDFGIDTDTKSAAVQWIGEGKRVVNNELVDYTLDDLKRDFSDDWGNIRDAADYIAVRYHEYEMMLNESLKNLFKVTFEDKWEIEDYKKDIENVLTPKLEEAQARVDELKARLDELNEITRKEGIKNIAEKIDIRKQLQLARSIRNDYQSKINYRYQQIEEMKRLIKDGRSASIRNRSVQHRENYFHHFRQNDMTFLQQLQQSMAAEASSDMNGVRDSWTKHEGFLDKRKSELDYTADAYTGFLRYMEGAEYKLAFDPVIYHFRQLQHLSTNSEFRKFVENWAGSIAGDPNPIDRYLPPEIADSKLFKFISTISTRLRANKVVWNFMSDLVQISNLPNAVEYVASPKAWVKATKQTINALFQNQSMAKTILNASEFINSRYGETYSQTLRNFESAIDPDKHTMQWYGSKMLEALDHLSATYSWFAAYNQFKEDSSQTISGRTFTSAIEYADEVVRRSHGGRGIGEKSIAQTSRLVTMIAPFQLEVTNTFLEKGEMLKNLKDPKKAKVQAVRIMAGQVAIFALNTIFQAVLGSRKLPFDFINAIIQAIAGIPDEDDDDMDYRLVSEMLKKSAGTAVQGLPFATQIVSAFLDSEQSGKIFGDDDPTLYGTGQMGFKAIQKSISNAITFADKLATGNMDADDIITELINDGDIIEFFLPYGGTQLLRTLKGADTVFRGYSQKINENGEAQAQFGYDNAFMGGNVLNDVQSLMFGKWASPRAQEYLNGGKILTAEKTRDMLEAREAGVKPTEYFDLRDILKKEISTKENGKVTQTKQSKQFYDIANTDFTDAQKLLMVKQMDNDLNADGERTSHYYEDALEAYTRGGNITDYLNARGLYGALTANDEDSKKNQFRKALKSSTVSVHDMTLFDELICGNTYKGDDGVSHVWTADYTDDDWFELSMLGGSIQTRQSNYEKVKNYGLSPRDYIDTYNLKKLYKDDKDEDTGKRDVTQYIFDMNLPPEIAANLETALYKNGNTKYTPKDYTDSSLFYLSTVSPDAAYKEATIAIDIAGISSSTYERYYNMQKTEGDDAVRNTLARDNTLTSTQAATLDKLLLQNIDKNKLVNDLVKGNFVGDDRTIINEIAYDDTLSGSKMQYKIVDADLSEQGRKKALNIVLGATHQTSYGSTKDVEIDYTNNNLFTISSMGKSYYDKLPYTRDIGVTDEQYAQYLINYKARQAELGKTSQLTKKESISLMKEVGINNTTQMYTIMTTSAAKLAKK